MRAVVENVFKPLLVAAMAVVMAHCGAGCIPPGGAELEKQYQEQITGCVNNARTKREACFCRKAVDTKYGLCAEAEWPRIGRCDYVCEGL